MKSIHASVLLGLVAGLLGTIACDDDPSKLSTGVDGSKAVGTVTPSEAEQICKSTETWAKRAIAEAKQKELTCRIGALVVAAGGLGGSTPSPEAQLRMACQTSFDQCMMAAFPDAGSVAPMCQSFPAGCTATVAEYEACLNDVPQFVDRTIMNLPRCETLTQLSLISLLGLASTLPPTCQTFQMKCGGMGIPGIPVPMNGS